MPVLLDTTVLIDALRGGRAAARIVALRQNGELPYTCAINVEEIVRGLKPDEQDITDALFRGLRIVPLGSTEGERAGRWRRLFSAKGITLSQAGCLTAAAAVTAGARLATANVKDYPMAELVVEHWPMGRRQSA